MARETAPKKMSIRSNSLARRRVSLSPRRAANPRAAHTGRRAADTEENEKGSDGNGINPRTEPPAKLQRNYSRLFFRFLHFQNSPANNGGVGRAGWGKKPPKITRIALGMKIWQACPVALQIPTEMI